MTSHETRRAIDPNVRLGHVHLKVADLERALRFYRDVLGFELTQRYGSPAAFARLPSCPGSSASQYRDRRRGSLSVVASGRLDATSGCGGGHGL